MHSVKTRPSAPLHTEKTQDRRLVVAAAIILNLSLGALYSWPVFANYLAAELPEIEQWNSVETQMVFSMATAFLAVGVIAAGQLSERREPKLLIILSAVFTGGGYVLGGILPLRPIFLTVTIGVMVGFGIGMAYALPISLAAKWFADRKGLVTGLAMAGFGVGSVLWSQTFDLFLAERLGISVTFILYGVVFAVLILFTARYLYNPPPGFTERMEARGQERRARRNPGSTHHRAAADGETLRPGFSPAEIVKQRQLYFLVYTFIVGSAVGLMVIGMSKTYPIERLVDAGYTLRAATNITRVGALILFPALNGSGRVVFGWLSDLMGWRPVIIASYITQSLILIFFPWLMSVPATVIIGLPLLAMCYGGNFTIFPVATGQIWGSDHLAANYSLVFVAFGVGALVGPPLSGLAKDAGAVNAAFLAAGILLAAGALLVAVVRKPRRLGCGPDAVQR